VPVEGRSFSAPLSGRSKRSATGCLFHAPDRPQTSSGKAAGQTIEDWLGTARESETHLLRIQCGDADSGHSFRHTYPTVEILAAPADRILPRLPRRGIRYTSDPGMLRDLSHTMNRKAEMIRALIAELRLTPSEPFQRSGHVAIPDLDRTGARLENGFPFRTPTVP